MKKIAIFNVGEASSAYIEIDGKSIVIDLGKSEEFNPVLDFLAPLAKMKNFVRSDRFPEKYQLEQTFLSHLDDDHISAIEEFDKYFHPKFLTAPCDNQRQSGIFRIVRDFFDKENKNINKVLDLMSAENRSPGYGRNIQEDFDKPLVVCPNCVGNFELYHIPAGMCQSEDSLKDKYSNNLSLIILLNINNFRILFTGDITNNGIDYLIKENNNFRKELSAEGIDFLIAPHHGLETTFPTALFETIKNNKVKLNIISEERAKKDDDENRSNVDGRYSDPNFSEGYKIINGLKDFQYSIMTSGTLNTHILIDFDSTIPKVKRCTTQDLLNEFNGVN